MKRVINFSGGKTSALMTIMNYREGDIESKGGDPSTIKPPEI